MLSLDLTSNSLTQLWPSAEPFFSHLHLWHFSASPLHHRTSLRRPANSAFSASVRPPQDASPTFAVTTPAMDSTSVARTRFHGPTGLTPASPAQLASPMTLRTASSTRTAPRRPSEGTWQNGEPIVMVMDRSIASTTLPSTRLVLVAVNSSGCSTANTGVTLSSATRAAVSTPIDRSSTLLSLSHHGRPSPPLFRWPTRSLPSPPPHLSGPSLLVVVIPATR